MFSKKKDYFRNDLLEYTGSRQPQTGIIYGDKQSKVIICTSGGRHAEEAGYNDKEFIDGTWLYYGQGEEGDQDPMKLPNALLIEGIYYCSQLQNRRANKLDYREIIKRNINTLGCSA